MAAYEIDVSSYQMLGYDLQAAVDSYTADLAAHAKTVGEAAPSTTSLVENIVRFHEGLWVIVPASKTPGKQPLPKDAKYYKSPADQAAVTAEVAAQESEV